MIMTVITKAATPALRRYDADKLKNKNIKQSLELALNNRYAALMEVEKRVFNWKYLRQPGRHSLRRVLLGKSCNRKMEISSGP